MIVGLVEPSLRHGRDRAGRQPDDIVGYALGVAIICGTVGTYIF